MIITVHARENFWLRLKMFFTSGETTLPTVPQKPKPRPYKTRAFLEMP